MNETLNKPINKWLLLVLAAISATTPLATDMYLPAMAQIASDLDSDTTVVQNSLSTYLLGFAVALFAFGPLADIVGRRPLVMLGLSGFILTSVALAYATSIESFLLFRSLQAVSGGAAAVTVPGVIRSMYGRDAAKGLSYLAMITMTAPLIAPSIGSLLLNIGDWRAIFSLQASLGAVVLCLSIAALPDFPELRPQGKGHPWFKLFCSGYIAVFSQKGIQRYLCVSMFASFGVFCFLTAVPFIYLEVFNINEAQFGLLFGLNVVGVILANLLNAILVSKHGSSCLLKYGTVSALLSSSILLIGNLFSVDFEYTFVSLSLLLASLTFIGVNSESMILTRLPKNSGAASGVLGSLRFGVGATAGPLLTLMYDGSAMPFVILMFLATFLIFTVQPRHRFKLVVDSPGVGKQL